MSRTVRSLAVLALAVWFLAGTVPAAAVPLFASGAEESVWSAAWEWVVGLLTGSDAGCTIDPNGQPCPTSTTVNVDVGIDLDEMTNGVPIDRTASRFVQ